MPQIQLPVCPKSSSHCASNPAPIVPQIQLPYVFQNPPIICFEFSSHRAPNPAPVVPQIQLPVCFKTYLLCASNSAFSMHSVNRSAETLYRLRWDEYQMNMKRNRSVQTFEIPIREKRKEKKSHVLYILTTNHKLANESENLNCIPVYSRCTTCMKGEFLLQGYRVARASSTTVSTIYKYRGVDWSAKTLDVWTSPQP